MADRTVFNRDSAERIADATRWVEGQQVSPSLRADPRPEVPDESIPQQDVFEHVVIREQLWDGEGETLLVAPLMRKPDGKMDFIWMPVYDEEGYQVGSRILTKRLRTFPDLQQKHYAAFAQPEGDEIVSETNIYQVYRWRGEWRLTWQKFRYDMPYQRRQFKIRGCLPEITP